MPEGHQHAISSLRTRSKQLGLEFYPGPSNQDELRRWDFASLYPPEVFRPGMTAVAVDAAHVHYVVKDYDDIATVWRENPDGIVEVVVVPDDFWEKVSPEMEVGEVKPPLSS